MRLVFCRGMVSDDTEHAVMTALSLARYPADMRSFRCDLARRMRWWFAALPPATGLATARACLKLWLGISPARSGIFSAGNGPAMRSGVIGVLLARDKERRREFISASTGITHSDPRAEVAAQAVAESAAAAVREGAGLDPKALILRLAALASDEEWSALMAHLRDALEAGASTSDFATALGLARGVSGYAYHTVPVAIYGWLRHLGNYRAALVSVLNCGGDTDTAGAIAGGLAALTHPEGIPVEWLDALIDWPLTVGALREIGSGRQTAMAPSAISRPVILLRNVFFLGVALCHGFRRLLP